MHDFRSVDETASTMKTTSSRFAGLIALIAISPLSAHAATQLQGAGATFPAPLYQRWIAEFSKANPGIQINYQGVGSGAGIKQFTDGLVTFGASDAAMTDAQIEKVKQGVVLIPATAGSIVLAYNLPGVETLKLSREAYVGIFLGKITKWSDPAITKTNEGVKIPDLNVTVRRENELATVDHRVARAVPLLLGGAVIVCMNLSKNWRCRRGENQHKKHPDFHVRFPNRPRLRSV